MCSVDSVMKDSINPWQKVKFLSAGLAKAMRKVKSFTAWGISMCSTGNWSRGRRAAGCVHSHTGKFARIMAIFKQVAQTPPAICSWSEQSSTPKLSHWLSHYWYVGWFRCSNKKSNILTVTVLYNFQGNQSMNGVRRFFTALNWDRGKHFIKK